MSKRMADQYGELFLAVTLGVMSHGRLFAGDDKQGPAADDSDVKIVRSLRRAIEESWLARPRRKPEYQECWKRLKQLASLEPDEAANLALDDSLSALERRLVDVATALKVRPETWEELDIYYEKSWPNCRTRSGVIMPPVAPRSLEPEKRHLTARYRQAWEWTLLRPKAYGWRIARTAAIALAEIGEADSLELMEAVYGWALQAGRRALGGRWILRAMGRFKEKSRPEALKSAWRCWLRARELVGTKVNKHYTVEIDAPDRALATIARAFSADFVTAQLQMVEPTSGYANFLTKVRALQQEAAK